MTTFHTYIVKISRDANDDVGVMKNVKELLNDMSVHFINELTKRAADGLKKRNTIQERDIQTALEGYFPEGITKLLGEVEDDDKILFSTARTEKQMRENLSEDVRLSKKAVVVLAAALEQVIVELTKAANEYSQKYDRRNITLPDLEKAIKHDAELGELMKLFPRQ
jgi:histone H3/H4